MSLTDLLTDITMLSGAESYALCSFLWLTWHTKKVFDSSQPTEYPI
jgi:hypothetical protein